MFANIVMSKKLTRHARVVFAIVCISLPQLGFTANCTNPGCSSGTPFCNQCVSAGSNCATSINAARLDCLADTDVMIPIANTNYYLYLDFLPTNNLGCNALRDHLCSFRTTTYQNATVIIPKEIVCTASGNFSGAKIYLSFEQDSNNNEPYASTVDFSLNGRHYIPYFNSECKVDVSYDTSPYCHEIDSNFTSFTFNGQQFNSNFTSLTWNHTHARWNNISDCGGVYSGSTMSYSEAHCNDGYTQPLIYLTASLDGSGKNKIWYARQNTITEGWKIYYSRTGSICTPCYNGCETGYTLDYSTSACPDKPICTVYTPDCPDGFTPSNSPPRCNVDSNISYTDETGIFTLANGFYDADTTGYTSNTTCDLQN